LNTAALAAWLLQRGGFGLGLLGDRRAPVVVHALVVLVVGHGASPVIS
jgi:hypothetical protein